MTTRDVIGTRWPVQEIRENNPHGGDFSMTPIPLYEVTHRGELIAVYRHAREALAHVHRTRDPLYRILALVEGTRWQVYP